AKNPEEFILKAANLINEQKATVIIEHITYNLLDETYDDDIFTDHTLKGKLGYNAISVDKSIFNNIVYDSKNEESFVKKLDTANEVVVYAKLPSGFYINTPVGKYNPDWAIAFTEETVKHIYFVAETKGSLSTLSLRGVEELKIHCAREHFRAISSAAVKYDVIDSYEELLNIVMR
ncbi:MAG: restriction endonuclease subunit R, partial [Candidatus Ornithomonoglobus sp.]